MGQIPSTEKKPEPKDQEVGPWQVAVCFMVITTLWMSSMKDLPPEAYGFYLLYSRTTMTAIVYVISFLPHRAQTLAEILANPKSAILSQDLVGVGVEEAGGAMERKAVRRSEI